MLTFIDIYFHNSALLLSVEFYPQLVEKCLSKQKSDKKNPHKLNYEAIKKNDFLVIHKPLRNIHQHFYHYHHHHYQNYSLLKNSFLLRLFFLRIIIFFHFVYFQKRRSRRREHILKKDMFFLFLFSYL